MRKRGQSTLEYAVLIAVVVGAFMAMQYYFKRGIQGKLHESADSMGNQYSAGNVTSKYATEQVGELKTRETFGLDDAGKHKRGVSKYTVTKPTETKRYTEAGQEEKITKKLSEEPLYPEE